MLVVLLFRVVGAVRFRETLLCLQQNHAFTRQQKHERKTFEQLQLRLRRTQGFAEWWKAICEAADALGFAWVSLTVRYADGSIDASVWREPETPTNDFRLVTMTMPIIDSKTQRSLEFEIAIKVNGSLESASHRAGLFGRLVDECNLIWLGPTQRTSIET